MLFKEITGQYICNFNKEYVKKRTGFIQTGFQGI